MYKDKYSFRRSYKNTQWNGTTRIPLIQYWTELRRQFSKKNTGKKWEKPSIRKSQYVTRAKVQDVLKKNRKLPAKPADRTLWNKLCVDLISLYKVCRKGKYPLILKSVKIIYPVTGWFEVTHYSDKKAMVLANFVETMWLVQYPWPVEIKYDQGGELPGHEFKNSLI